MRTLITSILVLMCVFHLNTRNAENEKVVKNENYSIKHTKEHKIDKKEDSLLKITKVIVKDIVKNVKNVSIFEQSVPMIENSDTTSIEQRIRTVLKNEGMKPFVIELLVAQSKHESGNYKNGLTPYNNIFARHYFKADTFAISAGAPGEGHRRFAKYPSIEYATLSQIWYFRRKGYSFNWDSTYEFAAECKRKGYYEAPLHLYVSALNSYIR
jgi:hypothetical protein